MFIMPPEWVADVAAADWHASHGIYGGLSPTERRVILRERAAERKAS